LGVIAVSDEIVFEPLVSNVRLSGDKIEFEADAPAGTRWVLESSPNTVRWSELGIVEGNETGRQTVTHPLELNVRFLRLRKE